MDTSHSMKEKKTVAHIPTGYINATVLVSQFQTKNNTRKEFYKWKNRNIKYINNITEFVKAYASDELMNYDDGSQSIMFTINETDDLFEMDDTSRVHVMDGIDTSLSKYSTFNTIKGTYVHPILISHLLMHLDITLEGIHTTIVFNNYKEQSFKKAVLDNKLTPAQAVECRTQLTNEINTCNAHITGCTVKEVEKDNTDYESKYNTLKLRFAAAKRRIKTLEKENEDLAEESNHWADTVQGMSDTMSTLTYDNSELKQDIKALLKESKQTNAKLDKITSSISKVTGTLDNLAIKIATNAALDPNKKEGVLIGFNTNPTRGANVFEIHCGQQEYLDPIIKRYAANNIKYALLHNIANSKSTLNQLVKELKLKRVSNTYTFKNINNVEKTAYQLLNEIDGHYQTSIGNVTSRVMEVVK